MWFFLIPLGFAWWSYRRRHDYRAVRGRPLFHGWRNHSEHAERSSERFAHPLHRAGLDSPMLALPTAPVREPDASATAADYLKHVRDAAHLTAALDYFAQGPALLGDVQTLMHAPGELAQALTALQAPMDVVTVQRDLNVLGCAPALSENGALDAHTTEAIKALQSRFGQVPTGEVDSDTRVAIRYSVGSLHVQSG
jgi:Putative peptidoglycan binding domain